MLITGPTGVGETGLACALAHKGCREGYSAQYIRLTRLLRELTIAKGDGRYVKLLANLAKVDVLILDDLGLMKLNAANRRDLLEVLEDRHGNRSTVATSQLPIEEWTLSILLRSMRKRADRRPNPMPNHKRARVDLPVDICGVWFWRRQGGW